MRWIFLFLSLGLTLALPASAQDDDRGFITGLLEDNLSDAGRNIRIDGFEGALSSRATFDTMTIADAEGVWLTINNGAISWNRSALLSGRIEIEEMSANEILLPRLPVSDDSVQAEASGFAIPELPVSVLIGAIRANRVALGEPVLGTSLEVSLKGSLELDGGDGSAALDIARIDGQEGALALAAAYANETRELTLDLLATEAEGGIVASKIGLPGAPALTLAVSGTGVIDDFTAEINLSSDNMPRLAGTVTLAATTDPNGRVERGFRAELGGDIAPLFLPEYRDFFGEDVRLLAEGQREASGKLTLSQLELKAEAIDLAGQVELAPDGLPVRLDLTAGLGLPDRGEILLPLAGDETWLRSGRLRLNFDSTQDDGWDIVAELKGLRRPDIRFADLALDGSGRITRDPRRTDGGIVGGTMNFSARGIEPSDPALAQALGDAITGSATFYAEPDRPLRLPTFGIVGEDFAASGRLSLDGVDTALTLAGEIEAEVQDFSRFSALAGRDLDGAATLSATGSAGLLSGEFDIESAIDGRDLVVSQSEVDRLLRGASQVTLSAARDTGGTVLRDLSITAATLSAQARGTIKDGASDLTATLDFADLSVMGPQYRGAFQADATLAEDGPTRRVTLAGEGRNLAIGQAEADKLLAGTTAFDLAATLTDGVPWLERLSLSNPQINVDADGSGSETIDLEARLSNLALLVEGFPGPVTLGGTVARAPEGFAVDLSGTGPGQISAAVTGTLASGLDRADLSISGTLQSAILNPFIAPRNIQGPVRFDLSLDGAPELGALSGQISAAGARLVAPTVGISLEEIGATLDLSGGRATVSVDANVVGGGRITVTGPIELTAPYAGDLSVALARARLRDPELYDTRVDGTLSVSGPLTGGAAIAGALRLDETEIRVPSTGLGGAFPIPDVAHLAEPARVRETRARAGLLENGGNGADAGGQPFGLDISVSAPNQIFVRGRGLDAELGGALRLAGTTDAVQAIGQFDLVRGRLDILGQRFVLDEGRVQMQGDLIPTIRFSASTESDGYTSTILIDGPASEPEITFLSSPELPQEEVLSRLLFGRGLTTLSAFQAAQLASAVATLAGKGGEGIVGRLRKGFGLDDFDVTTGEDGEAAVRAGKYLSDNLYTDVTIGSEGTSEINLNLDVTPQIKLRGSVDSEGDTGIGVFFEKDY